MKIIFSLLFLLSAIQIGVAQRILVDGKLPKDLQITIDNTGTQRFADSRRYTISAVGVVTYIVTSQGLPLHSTSFGDLLVLQPGVQDRKAKFSKPKKPDPPPKKKRVSRKQLLDIARVVEASGFFQMLDRYQSNINHHPSKAIYITANGRSKGVYFPLPGEGADAGKIPRPLQQNCKGYRWCGGKRGYG